MIVLSESADTNYPVCVCLAVSLISSFTAVACASGEDTGAGDDAAAAAAVVV